MVANGPSPAARHAAPRRRNSTRAHSATRPDATAQYAPVPLAPHQRSSLIVTPAQYRSRAGSEPRRTSISFAKAARCAAARFR